MADELSSYWFVAAVFREAGDLAAAIADLCDSKIPESRLLVIANHSADAARQVLRPSLAVPVVAVNSGDALQAGDAELNKLPHELHAFLDAIYDGAPAAAIDREKRSQVYTLLRQDVADGAFILIANVSNPDEQLAGARTLLRENCECVLTHEMTAERA